MQLPSAVSSFKCHDQSFRLSQAQPSLLEQLIAISPLTQRGLVDGVVVASTGEEFLHAIGLTFDWLEITHQSERNRPITIMHGVLIPT